MLFSKRAKIEQINRAQLETFMKDKSEKRQYIDVRSPMEFKANKVKGFKNIPLDSIKNRLDEIDEDQPVILICASGSRSFFAGRVLAKAGYKKLFNVQRGMMEFN